MRITTIFSTILLCGTLLSCQQEKLTPLTPIQVIPQPVSVVEQQEHAPFVLKQQSKIIVSDSLMLPAAHMLQNIVGFKLPIEWNKKAKKSDIVFTLNHDLDSLSHEGYILAINKQTVNIQSAGPQGLFYAVETMRQLFPAGTTLTNQKKIALPAVKIADIPRFSWRGMHLDVSRHFMPVAFIKKYIDYLAMHKLNVFHWHLVDGVGWRIEIKSHPELTDKGAWRQVKEGKKPWQDFEIWKEGCGNPKYGGFYTQEEIKEVVQYAKERFITVLPEIELPGHSEVVMQCYPELICKDSKGKSLRNAGVYCASNPKSYQLLEDVINEVIELFPSEYIHIGGDEVGKSNWKKCASCQKLMKKNGYTPHELQSHFVNHFDKFLKSKGRKLIGWHEILEGELSPSATIMYWGGENGVTKNLKAGHPTVLTTGSHFYFDHYQSLSPQEPKAFGGFAPLKKVYDYEPIPEDASSDQADLIMGVQGNVWTEYMPVEAHVEYMIIPRIAALAEVAWQDEKTKDWERFRTKMNRMFSRYVTMGINAAPSAYRPQISYELTADKSKLKVTIDTELEATIYYTTNGNAPDTATARRYTTPFLIDKSAPIKVLTVEKDKNIELTETEQAILHKACKAKVKKFTKGWANYKALGATTLIDANFGGNKWGNGKWLGVLGRDFEAELQFPTPTEISKVGFSCIEETGAGIYYPASIEVLGSKDGKQYKTLKTWSSNRKTPIPRTPECTNKIITLNFTPATYQYVKVKAKYQHVKNQGVFIFVDELIVE
ncbi:hypothetical protein EYV94_18050 [Puteibacter caeruleilacunae]|nr:hypothetical protein EYV94_18050 [Puteibacter caeruleilacunae]